MILGGELLRTGLLLLSREKKIMATRLVVLLGLLSLAAGGSWFADFTAGFNQGSGDSLDCTADPAHCLRSMGRGLGMVTSVEWKKTANEVAKLTGGSTPLSLYFAGFLRGLQNDPNSSNMCTSLITNWIDLIGSLSPATIQTLTFLEIVEAGCSVFYEFNNEIYKACNLQQLIYALRYNNLYDYLLSYLRQNCAINSALIGVQDCSEDYYECGYSSGVILRLETGWAVDQQQ